MPTILNINIKLNKIIKNKLTLDKNMKKHKKIFNWIFNMLFLTYVSIIFFPQLFFANKLEYKNFSVYYHSNDINTKDLKLVLDKSEKLLKKSDLFNKETSQYIFICNGHSEFAFFSHMGRKAFAVNYAICQNIFISKSSISQNYVLRNAKENNKRTLSGVIAHETVHSLLENKLGLVKYLLLPSWKNEGYCDFIANESSYNKQKGIKEICNSYENTNVSSFKYFKYRMMTEYLFEERKVTLGKFLNDDFDLENINNNLKEKYCAQWREG